MSTTIRPARTLSAVLLAAAMVLCSASAAHALRIELGDATRAMANDWVEISRETRTQNISVSIYGGGSTTLTGERYTIAFRQGPVLLTDARRAGGDPNAVPRPFQARLVNRVHSWRIFSSVPLALEFDAPEATLIVPPTGGQPVPGVPVPEPGAALLFGAGLATIGAARRR